MDDRNPLLSLPSARRLAELDPDARDALRALLADLRADADARAENAWRRRKGPMAAYWRAVATYARHTRLAIPPSTPTRQRLTAAERYVASIPVEVVSAGEAARAFPRAAE